MLDHPGAIQVPTGAPKWPKTAPKGPRMAQNHQNGTTWPQMTLKHSRWVYYVFICHIEPPWALFRGPQGPHNGPKQHQKWPFMTQNGASMESLHDPKCTCMTPNGPKTFLRGMIHDYMTYRTTLGPFQRPTWPQWASEKAPRWSSMTQYHIIF